MSKPARLLFFGRLADIAGARERAFDLPGPISIASLMDALGAGAPELAGALAAPSVRVAINQAIVRGRDAMAGPGDEIAFLPPVSGG
jgi:molybdopterin synthase sulfur carrier subunit